MAGDTRPILSAPAATTYSVYSAFSPGHTVEGEAGRRRAPFRPLEVETMVKKGQLEVSKMDSPRQGEARDPHAKKIQRTGGSHSQTRARPPAEGSSAKG
jgi:hypothetical protein